MTTVIEHYESVLGPIRVGWATGPDGDAMPFQVVRFDKGSSPGIISFATLGLGGFPLSSPTSGRAIRHELLMLAPKEMESSAIPSLLLQVGSAALQGRRALVRGDVIGPHGRLLPETSLEALYVTAPVYLPDEFATCEGEDGPVVVAWLVPISASEANYVANKGWDAFEDRLVEQDPDLTDFSRAAIQL